MSKLLKKYYKGGLQSSACLTSGDQASLTNCQYEADHDFELQISEDSTWTINNTKFKIKFSALLNITSN